VGVDAWLDQWLIDIRFTRAAVNCSEYDSLSAGQVHFVNRIKYVPCLPTLGGLVSRQSGTVLTGKYDNRSHPDVAERHYPNLFKQFFPRGLPTHETAY